MVLVGQVGVLVVHVLAGVDVEVILLFVLDFKQVLLDEMIVLSEICSNDWLVVVG